MKTNHNNLELIQNWLTESKKSISMTEDFVREVHHSVLEPKFEIRNITSIRKRERAFSLQYDFVRRDLLKILYKQAGNSTSGIQSGYMYAISNPAWFNWFKIGSTIDVLDRLGTYQTGSPFRDFKIVDYYFVWDRREEEAWLHSTFPERNNEWCASTEADIKRLFLDRKKARIIKPTEDNIWLMRDLRNTQLNLQKYDWYQVLNVPDDAQ